MAAEGLITFDELRAKLAALEETREVAELEIAALRGQRESLGQMERDKDAVLEHYVKLTPEDRRKLYNTLRLRAIATPTNRRRWNGSGNDKHTNPKLPYFLRTVAHTCTTEAMALMMGSLAEEPGWLKKGAGVSENELDGEKLAARRKADGLVFTRCALVVFNFDKALYENPVQEDLNSMWWDLVERLQLVNRSPGRDEPDWAAKTHLAVASVYYHNHVLGHLISAQLRNHLESHVTRGPFYEHEVAGRYPTESFFGPGARESWRDTVLRAPGEDLDPDHFVGSLR